MSAILRPTRPIELRFLAKVSRGEGDACWLWTGATSQFGHGVIGHGRRGQGNVRAHRVAWELYRGAVPEGMQVNHRCDVPACVNPEHLYLGTQADNMRDVSDRRRYSLVHAKIDAATAKRIRVLRRSGVVPTTLAVMFGISARHVRRIVSRDRWRHVD